MRQDGSAGSGQAVLVAIADERRPEAFARALARAAMMPALAFDDHEVRAFMRSMPFAAVVVDGDVDPSGAATAPLAGRRDVVVCFLARDAQRAAPDHAHAVFPADIAPAELASRVRALVGLRGDDSSLLSWGPLQLDLHRRRATFDGVDLLTTPVQFRILAALARAHGGVVTKEELQSEAWPWAAHDDGERLVAHIRRIRAKLESYPSGARFLVTARGEGFRLTDIATRWDGVDRRKADRRIAR
jgi:DNA-binding winged helix-turn-helix (wHTH) protein